MSARARAVLYFALAGLAAVGGATVVGRYSQSSIERYGELRPTLVSTVALPASDPLSPATVGAGVEVRQVPESFRPVDSITRVRDAIGLQPAATLPPGTYLTRSVLRPPKRPTNKRPPRLAGGLRPVEILVSGARSLAGTGAALGSGSALGGASALTKVDVVVTTEPGPGGAGRTFVAAPGVPLLSFGPAPESAAPGLSTALLGLNREQALRLIGAESFARSVRLLPGSPG